MPGKSVNFGEYAFIGGLLVAAIIGVLSSFVPGELMPALVALLFVLGLVVGLLNIQEKEATTFLIAAIALLLAATSWNIALVQTLSLIGEAGLMVARVLTGLTAALAAFIAPAAFVVAVKAVYKLAQPD
jgi:hypothetical protein